MAFDALPGIHRTLEVARAEGVPYGIVPGYETRGSGRFTDMRTALDHHDAFPARSGHFGGLRTCTFGRPDLRNSLCMYYLGSDDVEGPDGRHWSTFHVVAALVSWHAGKGRITTNPQSRGIEARNSGLGEPWPTQQQRTYLFLDAMAVIVWGVEVYDHKEHSSTGKIDRTGIDPHDWRRQVDVEVARLLARYPQLRTGAPIAVPAPPAPPIAFSEEPTMIIYREPRTVSGREQVFAVDHAGGVRRHITRAELNAIVKAGGVRYQDPTAHTAHPTDWMPPVAGSWIYDIKPLPSKTKE